MKVKEESEKVGLKLNIQKTKIMASGPITSWQIDGETVKTVTDFFFFHRIIIFYFIYFYFYFILLYNTVFVLPYIDMNPPQVYMSSQT